MFMLVLFIIGNPAPSALVVRCGHSPQLPEAVFLSLWPYLQLPLSYKFLGAGFTVKHVNRKQMLNQVAWE